MTQDDSIDEAIQLADFLPSSQPAMLPVPSKEMMEKAKEEAPSKPLEEEKFDKFEKFNDPLDDLAELMDPQHPADS